ncbi:MAG: LuxR C-terminal-related transcriptional regulator [Bacteroidales bacterium]|jgi:DNA-binding CsgD family transcriptional regulator|nr:LuxR C-terminal-related transcriptional regulator [Bacteroidales bacterium]
MSESFKDIRDIRFSSRELDVISCIITGKTVKIIAILLDVSPYTVNTHIRNICAKIGCSSQREIISFIEHSAGYQDIYKRYITIISDKEFAKVLQKIAEKGFGSPKECVIYTLESDKSSELCDCLARAGLKIHLAEQIDSYYRYRNENNALHIICSSEISKFNKENTLFFAEHFNDYDERCIAYGQPKNFHYAVLDCLKKAYDDIDIGEEIKCFKRLYETKTHKNIVSDYIFDVKHGNSKIRTTLFTIAVIAALFLCSVCMYKRNVTVISNIVTISDSVYIARHDMEQKIKSILSKQARIKVIQLYGPGGSGKTTIARKYLRMQKANIIWEINAETEDSLMLSLYKLAHLLAKTQKQMEELIFLKSHCPLEDSKIKLMALIASEFKASGNWSLIFDNVDDFNMIKDFIPADSRIWGNGTVIITTRNAHIKNSIFLNADNVLFVDQLSSDEKLQLFNKICLQDNLLSTEKLESTKQFLNCIPSMPLDITAAAYYIKATNISYEDYLNRIHRKEFDKVQSKILSESLDYAFTRYGIIKTTLGKVLSGNPVFKKLLLNLALLNAEGIFRTYLCDDDAILDDFLYHLQEHSLVQNEEGNISIHRSTQELALIYLKDVLTKEEQKQYVDELVKNITPYNRIAWYLYPDSDKAVNATMIADLMQHLTSFNNKIQRLELDKDFVEYCKIKTDLALLHTYKYVKSKLFIKEFSESIIDRNSRAKVLANLDLAVLLEVCASKCLYFCEYAKAKVFIEDCLKLCDKTSNSDCIKAICLADASVLSEANKNFTEAEQYIAKALALVSSGKEEPWKIQTKVTIFNRYYGNCSNHYVVGSALKSVIDIALSILQQLKADKLFHKNDEEYNSDKAVSIFLIRRKLATLYNRIAQFDEAFECEKEAEYMVKKIKQAKIPFAEQESNLLIDFGYTLLRKNKISDAHNFLTDAIKRKIKNEDNSGMMYAYMYRAEANIRMNKLEEAYNDCSQSIKFKRKYNNNFVYFSEAVCNYYMAVVRCKQKNSNAALMHLNTLRVIFNKIGKDIFPTKNYELIEYNELLQGDFKDCKEGFQKISKVFNMIYGEDHPFVKSFTNAIDL